MIKNTNAMIHHIINKGSKYFIHFLNDTPPHIASAARISPPVGAITLVKASPN